MTPDAGPVTDERQASDYRRLLTALAARARWLGSRDPEAAAQEALKRSLQNPDSQPAVEYYFSQNPLPSPKPEWPLDQLFAWLHGVLRYVVREEQSRAGYRREVPIATDLVLEPADPAPNQLDVLMRKELEGIIENCFPKLEREYRKVLRMRAEGLKYGEIAGQLGVSENTVATWVSRGIRALGKCVRHRGGAL
jgi:RNA polymerase sigma factor (sigma-70 family)